MKLLLDFPVLIAYNTRSFSVEVSGDELRLTSLENEKVAIEITPEILADVAGELAAESKILGTCLQAVQALGGAVQCAFDHPTPEFAKKGEDGPQLVHPT